MQFNYVSSFLSLRYSVNNLIYRIVRFKYICGSELDYKLCSRIRFYCKIYTDERF